MIDKGQWLHPSSLAFEFAAGIRHQLIPALLALFSATTGTWLGGLLALLFFVGSMMHVVLRYVRLRYRVSDDELIINEGIVFRMHRTIPVQRIQNVDLVQNPFHRLLGVAEVRVETASGTEPEAVLRVLSLADVEALRARIFARKQSYELASAAARSSAEAAGQSPERVEAVDQADDRGEPPRGGYPVDQVALVADRQAADRRETLMKLSLQQLALAGIATDRGTVLLFVGLGLVWQQASSPLRNWAMEYVVPYLPKEADSQNWLLIAIVGLAALVGLVLLVKILSIVWYVLKFYDYVLVRSDDELRVSCGLLTRVSATVRRDRIQLISVHRTLIGRWLKIASIRVETAGGGADSDDPTTTIARRWFMPVISEIQIPAVMEQLSPGVKWNEQAFDWQPLSQQAARRMRRIAVFATGSLALVAGGLRLTSIAIALVLLAVFAWWWAGRRAASLRYARSDGKLIFRSGVLTRKCSLAFIDKIQSVTIRHSPFDRRWKMATLTVDTIASGPAEHHIAIPMLDLAVARNERDLLCRAASLAR